MKTSSLIKKLNKPSRAKLIKKLDALFAVYIKTRDNYTCRRCHAFKEKNAQNSHYWSRRHLGSRFDPDNCIVLCAGCHMLWEGDKQGDYKDLMEKWLGADRYKRLEIRARATAKFSLIDLQLLYEDLERQYKKLLTA